MDTERIIMHIDMDAFFAAVEESINPQLRGRPVVIGSDPKEGKGRGVVSTANYEARRYNIFSATPISIAYKNCPHATFIRPDFSKYSTISKSIMLILKKYSGRFQQMGSDEAYLDLTEAVSDFREAKMLATRIKEEIYSQFTLTCSIGIGNNKLVAKIASDLKKPDAIVVVEDNRAFLDPIPIQKLYGVGKKTAPKIQELGIATIGDLARYDREKLMKRFGAYGLYLSLSARGNGSDFVGHDYERCSIGKERTFFQDVEDFQKVYGAIKKITERLHERLTEEKFAYKTVSIKIRTHTFKTYSRSHTLGFFYNDADTIEETAIALAKEFEGNKIRLIGVRISNLEAFKDQTTLEQFVCI